MDAAYLPDSPGYPKVVAASTCLPSSVLPGFPTNVCFSANSFPCWGDEITLNSTNSEGAVNNQPPCRQWAMLDAVGRFSCEHVAGAKARGA